MTKKEMVTQAFTEYANDRVGEVRTRPEIREAVEQKLSFDLEWDVADFALPEATKPRTKLPVLFKRIVDGVYFVKGTFTKVIVTVSGMPNCGKTTTLREVIKQLIAKHSITKHKKLTGEPNFWEEYTLNGEPCDGSVVLYDVGAGKITVGVATSGDTESVVQGHIDRFNKHECDVIFCATRHDDGTLNPVKAELVGGARVLPFFKPMYAKDDKSTSEAAKIVIAWAKL